MMSPPLTELLWFDLAEHHYAIDVREVVEIRRWAPPSHVPGVPRYMRGLINFRGMLMPVFDLRQRLGLPTLDEHVEPQVICACLRGKHVGVVVDEVRQVLAVTAAQMRTPSPVSTHPVGPHIVTWISTPEAVVTQLDLAALLAADLS